MILARISKRKDGFYKIFMGPFNLKPQYEKSPRLVQTTKFPLACNEFFVKLKRKLVFLFQKFLNPTFSNQIINYIVFKCNIIVLKLQKLELFNFKNLENQFTKANNKNHYFSYILLYLITFQITKLQIFVFEFSF